MGPVTRLVQTGIGLAAELKAAKAERKSAEVFKDEDQDRTIDFEEAPALIAARSRRSSEADEHFMGGGGIEDENAPIPLDNGEAPPPYSAEFSEDVGSPQDVKFPPPAFTVAPSMLSCPVIIPQRRPGSKTRGFMRAYAPVLSDYDITEKTFLDFLKTFHKSSQASPILNVITIGAGALGNIPEPFSVLAAISITLISGTAAELQGRHRTNNYLTRVNEELFKPRGLFCLIMSFRPNDVPKEGVSISEVDTSNAAALKWSNPTNSSIKMQASNFRTSSGTTHGEMELPETAPLIYADTGYVELGKAKGENREETRGSFSSKRKVAAAYFDKRAQAKYAYKHPDSALATETTPTFASKYGDPTHPSVTAGYTGRISAKAKNETLAERQARKKEAALKPGSARGRVARILPNSVLYLMIVNLPTEEDLADARRVGVEERTGTEQES